MVSIYNGSSPPWREEVGYNINNIQYKNVNATVLLGITCYLLSRAQIL